MDEISLYRKYRPHNFENLVGQNHVKTTLINALKNKHVAHAYLFTGPRGTGKTSSARLIAKALNCENLNDEYEPCGECEFCQDINEGRLIDLIEIDAASNRGIDEVRDLKEKINFAPSRSKFKVYIIDEVHMMTKEAFNALLKTLEEPPSHAYFILATTEVHKIPETIISRCQRFDFRRIEQETVAERLKFIAEQENITIDENSLKAISKHVDGGMRDAIGLLEQLPIDGKITFENVQEVLGVSNLSLLEDLYTALRMNDTDAGLKVVNDLHIQGSDLKQFIHDFVEILRDKLLACVKENKQQAVGRIMEMIEIFQEAQNTFNPTLPQLPLEIAVIKITGKYEKPDGMEFVSEVQNVSEPSRDQLAEKKKELKKNVELKVERSEKTESENVNEPSQSETEKVEEKKEIEIKEENKTEISKDSEDSTFTGEISMEMLKDKWPRITERVKKPSLRMSLKNAKPVDCVSGKLTLQFSTNFHKNKVMEQENVVVLESVISELTNSNLKIESIVKEIEIKSVTKTANSFQPPAPPPPQEEHNTSSNQNNTTKNEGGDMVNQALEIFGGELMD